MNKRRLLCVEKDHSICDLIARILENFEVTVAHTVRDAELLIADKKFDLLLMNSHLPDGSGLTLCRAIREFDVSTPILFVVGRFVPTEADIKAVGGQGFVYKGPRFVEELERKVGQLFDRKTGA